MEQAQQVSYTDQYGQKVAKLGEGYWEINGVHWFAKNPDSITPQFQQVYNALKNAADKMSTSNYRQQRDAYDKKYRFRKRKPKFAFTVNEGQQRVVNALEAMSRDTITPEQAMAVLHEYDVMQERFPKEK